MTQQDIPVACLTISRHGRVESVNAEVGRLLGRSTEELVGMPFSAFLAVGNVQQYLAHLWETFRTPGEMKTCEVSFLTKGGRVFQAGLQSRTVLEENGSHDQRCRSVFWVTPPPDFEAESGQELFESLPYGAVWLDDDEVVEKSNPAFCRLLDYDPVSLVRCPIRRLFPEWSSENALAASLQGRSFRIQGLRRDGVLMPVAATLVPLKQNLGSRAYLCFVRSLVEQEGLERRALRTAELERQAIGRELHDSLGQNLVGMAFLADELAAELGSRLGGSEERSTEMAERAKRLARLCRETSKITRGLVRGLVPVALAEGGLAATLRDLADWVKSTSKVSCRTNCREAELPTEVAEHFFRIAQESVTNALKHSGCSELDISLELAGERSVLLSVRDNGQGLAFMNSERFGSGLYTMKHRAKMIDATLSLLSDSATGTCVTLRWTSSKVRLEFPESDGVANEE